MASYSPPQPAFIRRRSGLNEAIEAYAVADIDRKLRVLRAEAEAIVAVKVTEARFDSSDLTARQVILLKSAVALRTASAYLLSPAVQVATGTQSPLLMKDPAEIRDLAGGMLEDAAELEDAINRPVTSEAPDQGLAQRPYAHSSTYRPTIRWRPSQRLKDMDEGDDVPEGHVFGGAGSGSLAG